MLPDDLAEKYDPIAIEQECRWICSLLRCILSEAIEIGEFVTRIKHQFDVFGKSYGCDNPQRQGLSADLADGFRPNNVLGGIPTLATDHSPLWDAQLFEWTPAALANGFRGQIREEFQILTFVRDGLITDPVESALEAPASRSIVRSYNAFFKAFEESGPAVISLARLMGAARNPKGPTGVQRLWI